MRNKLGIGIATSASLVIAFAVWIARPDSMRQSPEGFTEQAAKAAKPIYDRVPQITIPTEVDEVAANLELAAVRGETKIGRERAHAVLRVAAEFLVERFARDDPATYRAWRTSNRFQWRDREFLNKWWTIDKQYEKYADAAAPVSVGLPEMFDLLWRRKQAAHAGFNRVVGMSADSSGMSIVFGTMTPGNPAREFLVGRLSSVVWHGGISSTHCSWFVPPRPYKERLAQGESVDYAEVGLIMSHADGSRRPLIMTYIWDSQAVRWELQVLNTNNEPSDKLVSIDY